MFAKKIEYTGGEDGFTALIEMANKKGGEPARFILYRYNGSNVFEMVEFGPEKKELAKKSFPLCLAIYDEKLLKSGLPKHMCIINSWKRTTRWLFDVAVGGGYEVYLPGTWVKIGLPARWKTSRKRRKPLCFGNLGQILAIKKELLKKLEQEELDLMNEAAGIYCDCYSPGEGFCTCEGIESNEGLERQLKEKRKEIERVKNEKWILEERMRYVIRNAKFTNVP